MGYVACGSYSGLKGATSMHLCVRQSCCWNALHLDGSLEILAEWVDDKNGRSPPKLGKHQPQDSSSSVASSGPDAVMLQKNLILPLLPRPQIPLQSLKFCVWHESFIHSTNIHRAPAVPRDLPLIGSRDPEGKRQTPGSHSSEDRRTVNTSRCVSTGAEGAGREDWVKQDQWVKCLYTWESTNSHKETLANRKRTFSTKV